MSEADCGALLVRCGLIGEQALGLAQKARVYGGNTLCEQLVLGGMVRDDELTRFFRERMMIAQIHPHRLDSVAAEVIQLLPAHLAIRWRAIPVQVEGGELVCVLSDPIDQRAIAEIEQVTRLRVRRAFATQAQLAWCLARYYRHVTPLAKTLVKRDPPRVVCGEIEVPSATAAPAYSFPPAPACPPASPTAPTLIP